MRLEAQRISAGYGATTVLRSIDLTVTPGEFVGIIGPNGSGKSTLLRALAGLHKSTTGRVMLGTTNIDSMPPQLRARCLAVVPQQPISPPGLTVRQLVACGRAPYAKWFRSPSHRDQLAIDSAIEQCELGDLADRSLSELSGGERQRAWIAMALCQQPRILLLDEPTSALDVGHQFHVMRLLEMLADNSGISVVLAIHDLNLAVRYCRRLVVLCHGQVAADFNPREGLNSQIFENAFDVHASLMASPDSAAQTYLFFDPVAAK